MGNKGFAKVVRIAAIVVFSLTAAINLLGGVGTVCAAFLTENFPSMSAILPYRGLYQVVMVLTVLAGITGVWFTIKLIKGSKDSYRNAVILLAVGTALAATQVVASLILRGKAVPANMKLYANAITLVLFLGLGLPGLRRRIEFENRSDQGTKDLAGGLAAVVCGLLVLTTGLWVGASHTVGAENWVRVLREPLLAAGISLNLGGLRLLLRRSSLPVRRSVGRSLAR